MALFYKQHIPCLKYLSQEHTRGDCRHRSKPSTQTRPRSGHGQTGTARARSSTGTRSRIVADHAPYDAELVRNLLFLELLHTRRQRIVPVRLAVEGGFRVIVRNVCRDAIVRVGGCERADGRGARGHGGIIGAAAGIGIVVPGEAGVEVNRGCPSTVLANC